MKKAFTLIELLVVIAIIAILAAILFPVFAQAKLAAKKTQGVSNTKQTGTAFNIYLADYDDKFPLSHSIRADNSHRYGTIHPAPSNAIGSGWDAPAIIEQTNAMWHMSVQPYMKNWEMLNAPGQNQGEVPGEVFTGLSKPAVMGIMMNGLLNTYSATAVENGSVVPMAWTNSSISLRGRAFSNPDLRCDVSTPACVFNPGGHPQGGTAGLNSASYSLRGLGATYTVWTYSGPEGGAVITRTDSSTKYYRVGVAKSPNVNYNGAADPYALVAVGPDGVLGSTWSYWATNDGNCGTLTAGNTSGGARYHCFFRPDRQN